MINILYVHGYLGKANGNSSKLIRKALDNIGIDYHLDAPAIPLENVKKAENYLANISGKYDVVIASSMGAMLAMKLPGVYKIMINPASPKNIQNIPNEYSEEEFHYMGSKLNDFYETKLDLEFKEETYFVFGGEDKIADNYFKVKENYFNDHIFMENNMGHGVDEAGAEIVANIVKNISKDEDIFYPFPFISEE